MQSVGIVPSYTVPTKKDLLFFDRFISTGECEETTLLAMDGMTPEQFHGIKRARGKKWLAPADVTLPSIYEENEATFQLLRSADLLTTDNESLESLLRRTDANRFGCAAH